MNANWMANASQMNNERTLIERHISAERMPNECWTNANERCMNVASATNEQQTNYDRTTNEWQTNERTANDVVLSNKTENEAYQKHW